MAIIIARAPATPGDPAAAMAKRLAQLRMSDEASCCPARSSR
ncbi:hypothetical protein [Phenylobacterium sp.]|nr:hypothetical protein [Phenylobacterium sp.]HLZ74206.1 hypothetical protein [Phenylobacterium sp.]